MKNGELLPRPNVRFDVLVKMGRGICHRQNLAGLTLFIVALRAKPVGSLTRPLMTSRMTLPESAQPAGFHFIG